MIIVYSRREALEEACKQEPSFLTELPKRINNAATYICPDCHNGEGESHTGIVFVPGTESHRIYQCFKCAAEGRGNKGKGTYDIPALWQLSQGGNNDKAMFDALFDYYGIEIERREGSMRKSARDYAMSFDDEISQEENSAQSLPPSAELTAALDPTPVSDRTGGSPEASSPAVAQTSAPSAQKAPPTASAGTAPAGDPALSATGGSAAPQTSASPEAQTAQQAKPEKDYMNYFRRCHGNLHLTDYPAGRGLTQATLDSVYAGYDPEAYFRAGDQVVQRPALIIPTSRYSYIRRQTEYNKDDGTAKCEKSGKVHLLNSASLEGDSPVDEPVFVVEGEIDAMSICQEGGTAIALGSTANVKMFISLVRQHRPKKPLILALDSDAAGRHATWHLEVELCNAGIPFIVAGKRLTGECKDANERLTADRAGLDMAIKTLTALVLNPATLASEMERRPEERQKEIRQEYVDAHEKELDQYFQNVIDSANTERIKTGFLWLDTQILDGGLKAGLYVIGAISSLGKTTFAMQMCDQIAQRGHDVLIFSLEMARDELISKSISRHTAINSIIARRNGSATAHGFTAPAVREGSRWKKYTEEEKEFIHRAEQDYLSYAKEHVFIKECLKDFGVADVEKAVKHHIEATGSYPVVLIDYLQILTPLDPHATDKNNIDQAVKRLKVLSREKGIPVICISSFNRMNYNVPVSMEAFKESGAVEYSSDVLIGLQLAGVGTQGFDVNKAKRGDKGRRDIEAKILKNRDGKTGDMCAFSYYAALNYFDEGGAIDLDKAAAEEERRRNEAAEAKRIEKERREKERAQRRRELAEANQAKAEAYIAKMADRVMKQAFGQAGRASGTAGADSGDSALSATAEPDEDPGTQSAGDTSDYEHYEQSENPYFDAYGYFTMDLANPRPATVAGMARALKVSEAEVKAFIARHPSEWSIDADGQKVRYESRTHFDPAAEAALTGRSSASSGTADGTV